MKLEKYYIGQIERLKALENEFRKLREQFEDELEVISEEKAQ